MKKMKPPFYKSFGKRRSYLRPTRKKIPNLLDRVREHILWLRDNGAEDAKKRQRYFGGSVTKENLAKYFGVKEGEIQHCLQLLNQEGLVSQARKIIWDDGWHPDLYYIRDWVKLPDDDPEIKPLFEYENCPICESKLNEGFKPRSTLNGKYCENGCFEHYLVLEGNMVRIFDEEFHFQETKSKGLADRTKNNMNKKIKFWKKNYRYLFRIMEDN